MPNKKTDQKLNSREELLQLVEELEMGMTPEDAEEELEHLSDAEVELLLSMYRAVRDFEDEVEKTARKADPEKFAEIKDKYAQDSLHLKQNHNHKLEQIQKKADEKLDKVDWETRSKYRDLLYRQQVEFSHLDDDHKAIYSKLTSALAKG